jgi:hypothetical protein
MHGPPNETSRELPLTNIAFMVFIREDHTSTPHYQRGCLVGKIFDETLL